MRTDAPRVFGGWLAAGFSIVVVTLIASLGVSDFSPHPKTAAYNLLAQGFLSGHLYLAKPAPPSLIQAADPYDPSQNIEARSGSPEGPNGLHDFSYFKGRLYLYFSAVPALLVFIPAHLLSGQWLPHWGAVVCFCAAGLAIYILLMMAVRNTYFPSAGPALLAAGGLALGLASFAPLIASRAGLWEVPIACGYCMMAIALWSVFQALHRHRPVRWMLVGSLAAGLAFAARPNLIVVTPIALAPLLLAPVRKRAAAWAAAILPAVACGLLVAGYNYARFGSPFQFGSDFQLAAEYESKVHGFGLRFAPTNAWLYLLEPFRWTSYFPWVGEAVHAKLPAGHGVIEHTAGCLVLSPVLWLGLAAPLYLRRPQAPPRLAAFAGLVGFSAVGPVGLIVCFFGACNRYQFEFVPQLALLAVIGIFCAETMWPRGAAALFSRLAWIGALAASAAFVPLFALDRVTADQLGLANAYLHAGELDKAEEHLSPARALSPDNPGIRTSYAILYLDAGQAERGNREFAKLLADYPRNAAVYSKWSEVLFYQGRRPESIAALRTAISLDPGNPSYASQLRALTRASP